MYIFQAKQLVDITKGLDPLLCTFFSDLKELTRHHNEEDPEYNYILCMFEDGAAEFTIECITFNGRGYFIYEPYEALQFSIDFYKKYAKNDPDWAKLLGWALLQ